MRMHCSPYLAGEVSQQIAMDRASEPVKQFMLSQTREKDLMLFMDMGQIEVFDTAKDVPLHVLVPAFVISELRIAFQIGFMLFLPFLIVDLIVASVLMSYGYDDASTRHDLSADQTAPLRSHGRLVPHRGVRRPRVYGMRRVEG
jgi:type III secretory pathway component EscR